MVFLAAGVLLAASCSSSHDAADGGTDADTDSDSDTQTDTGEYVPQTCEADEIVTFTDPMLEMAVRKSVSHQVFGQQYGTVWTGDLTGEVVAKVESMPYTFAGNKGINHLGGIECLVNLKKASLYGNAIADIGLLAYLEKLETLYVMDNLVSDLGPIVGLDNLTLLDVSRNPVESMEPIGQLVNLKNLHAEGLGLTSLDWMENLNQITVLGLSDNAISDIGLLADHPQLAGLYLENNQISDISALAGHDGLASLWLSGNQITDISPLATATVYFSLRLDDNDIEDISALAEMGKTIDSGALCEVFLHGNRIVDLSPLAGMEDLMPPTDGPGGLTLWDNRIQDLSPLAGLPIAQMAYGWDFSRNEISDLGPLASFGDIGFLDISENKVFDLSPLAGKDLGELVARKNEIHDLTLLLGLHKPFWLDLTDNRVVSVGPLVALARMLPDDDAVEFLLGNPLGELATGFDIPRLCETLQHAVYFGDGETCSWNTYEIELPPYDPDPAPYTGPEKINSEGCDGAPAWLATGSLPGDSHAGAEFAVDDSVPAEPIVEDLLTGLQWRRCSVGQTPEADACAGSSSAMPFAEAASACEGSYGGHSDWRLPSLSELASLVNYSVSYPGPTIDAAAFPGTYTGGYWASTALPSTGGQAGWFVNFYNGSSMITARWDEDFVRRVRCVRGGGPGASWEERFAPGAVDGTTIADTWSGLEWRRCAEGQVWNGSTCAGIGDPVSGADAASDCAGEFAGHSDWRLPTIAELSSIANRCGADPASHTEAFPGLPGAPFWSSTTFPDTVEKTWILDFGFGWTAFVTPETAAWARCVR